MHIEWLQIENVRNLTHIRLQPTPQLNILVGPNASGKTSVLEAIYLLSRARSFRTSRISEVIQHNKQSLMVTSGLRYPKAGLVNTGIEKGAGSTIMHFNGENIKKISIQARNIPLILIAPDVDNLLLGTPKQRRHWLDWAMFHVEPAYLENWRDYHKALRCRNTLLKNSSQRSDSISGWEQVMTETGDRITAQRQRFIKIIAEKLQSVADGLLPFNSRVELYQGWQDGKSLLACLEQYRHEDRHVGYTRHGIHCSDIRFFTEERQIASVCSRGQIKLFLILLLVSLAQTIETISGNKPIYLLDDYRAEVDGIAGNSIMDLMRKQQAQVFFTTTEFEQPNSGFNDTKMFHVERDGLVKVVE